MNALTYFLVYFINLLTHPVLPDMLIKCIKDSACQSASIAIGVLFHFLYSLVPMAIGMQTGNIRCPGGYTIFFYNACQLYFQSQLIFLHLFSTSRPHPVRIPFRSGSQDKNKKLILNQYQSN